MAGDILGFVGVGRMGGPMASRLLDAGHRLCVYDLSEAATAPLVARGAQLAASPAEVAAVAAGLLDDDATNGETLVLDGSAPP